MLNATEDSVLGDIMKAEGVFPDTAKGLAPPKDGHELHSFIGLVRYYRQVLLRFSQITATLTQLLRVYTTQKNGGISPSIQS